MVSKTIDPKMVNKAISAALSKHKDLTMVQSNMALRAAVIHAWGLVIEETPTDEGRARGNWFITTSTPSTKIGDADKNKGSDYVVTATQKNMFGFKWFLTNNLPYINKLEFGGYSQGSGSTDKTTANGYSELAPKGMVRINMAKFPRILKEAFRDVTK